MIRLVVLALFQMVRGTSAGLPPVSCPDARDDAAMASALACMSLVAVPDLPSASGVITLPQARSPFGVAVTADGRPRRRLIAHVSGLPLPRRLGAFNTYIAWAYTLALDAERKLGVITNGRMDLGEIDRTQFRILVTAERSAGVRRRSGKLVLRGTSPSARLLAHRDLLQPSALSAVSANEIAAMHGGAHGSREAGQGWTMPPMPAGMPLMPSMAGVAPGVQAFLPERTPPGKTQAALQPHEVLKLQDGDTLQLEATIVTRSVAGRMVTGYAFNGQVPGPLIEVTRGTTIVVQVHNAIDQPTALHWHGLRLDNRSDGAVGVTQEAIRPGASYTYTVRFPDAGLYWYHPHVREDVQQSLGLYGNVLVRSPSMKRTPRVRREEVLMVGDALLGADGPSAFGSTAPTHALMGRWGNVLLVNGVPRYTLSVNRGAVVRFYLTNVASARLFNLSFSGARMKVIAADGGPFEREEWVQSIVIAPAERYIVDVEFPTAGDMAVVNRVQALDHMIGSYVPEVDTMGTVHVTAEAALHSRGGAPGTLARNADVAADLAPFRPYFDRPVDHELVLSMRTRRLPAPISAMLIGVNAAVEWNDGMPMANWAATGNEVTWVIRDPATGRENMDVAWQFHVGDVTKIRIFNDPASPHAMQHPIHLHGQRFLVLSRDGETNRNLAWKDTAIIAAGETVDILVDMSNPGRWMLHCHIAEHLGSGMMTTFDVAP